VATSTETAARAALFVEHARRYSELGWALTPLAGKDPVLTGWQETEPEAVELVAGKWSAWGKRRNMGVVLRGSQLAVVEPDTLEAHAKLLELLGGELPPVPIVKSGGKSLHLYFRDNGQGNGSVDGLELRANGQQCVVPPSVHPQTGCLYSWLEGHEPWTLPLVPVPDSVVAYFAEKRRKGPAGPVGDEIREKDPGRHKTLLSLAGSMRHRGMSGDEIAVALLAVNAKRCKPPLPDEEVIELARDVAGRYHPPPPNLEQERIDREADRLIAGDGQPSTEDRGGRLRMRPLAAVAATPVEFLNGNQLVPVGTKTLTAGVGGLGKSSLLLAWAAPVTVAGGTVLVVSYEDEASAVLRPRFEALGGDLERLLELYVDVVDGTVTFPTDLPELEQVVHETNARMLIVDPVAASLDMKLDSHKDRDVRLVLGRLAKLAERERLAVLLNAHLNKAPGSDPYLRVSGSVAFYNASRSVVTVTRDPAEPDWHRLVTQHKSNYGVLAPIQRWKFELVEIQSPSGPITVARMVYVEDADDISREDVLAPLASGPGKLLDAQAVIVAELGDGRRPSAEVKAVGVRQGHSERTIERAASELEVAIDEETTSSGRVTFWSLPEMVAPSSTGHIWRDPPSPHGSAESGGSEPGGRAKSHGHGATPSGLPSTCVVCDQPYRPDDLAATRLRCPDCVTRSQPEGAKP
jgi:Bifunctional DNA primase/polymerase, N-terminal/AAA domain/Primase C terminal 1 (PriCT-1)